MLTYDILINENLKELIRNNTSSLEVMITLRKTTQSRNRIPVRINEAKQERHEAKD